MSEPAEQSEQILVRRSKLEQMRAGGFAYPNAWRPDASAADLAKVVTNFSQADVAYNSLLQAESKILNLPTLLNYLQ